MSRRRGAVLFEFIRIGAYVKVIAVDERTGTEVSMVGDPSRSSEYLKKIALQKLERVMSRNAENSKDLY
ncbi:MAG: hypothetical protein CMP14_00990 [Rickettsiales bacterium]|nr:hypothetical protein [Rickettsiales bacterium]|tara:strand:- start:18187 stop:18393 length:207 start_codon:yes stop_codon:yes gene_type:complete